MTTSKKQPRKNLSKEQITEQLANEQKISHIKEIVRKAFPVIEKLDTIYDAQTAVNALDGLIAVEIEKKVKDIKLSELTIDLSKEDTSKIKTAIEKLVALFPDECAQELSETMERLGGTLQAYVANNAMKGKMNIKVDDIVSK